MPQSNLKKDKTKTKQNKKNDKKSQVFTSWLFYGQLNKSLLWIFATF